ncbi:MAG: heme-binding protein, partial [Methanoregulaceae archaeon]|nr:heme-binding protein [Methanoregulaceae archaeon]
MTDEVPFIVKEQQGEAEIRTYPAIRVASVSGYQDNEAFRFLFRYITGNNRAKKKIAMTAPVITAETIPMTAPVISDGSTMSFAMPEDYSLESLPQPSEIEVQLHEIPGRDVAVIRFSGRAGKKNGGGEDCASPRNTEGEEHPGGWHPV